MHVPVVLSIDEVRTVLAQLTNAPWIVVALLYGAGLRLQECLELRVKDLDFDRHQIVVRRGKGQKDVGPCFRPRSRPASPSISNRCT